MALYANIKQRRSEAGNERQAEKQCTLFAKKNISFLLRRLKLAVHLLEISKGTTHRSHSIRSYKMARVATADDVTDALQTLLLIPKHHYQILPATNAPIDPNKPHRPCRRRMYVFEACGCRYLSPYNCNYSDPCNYEDTAYWINKGRQSHYTHGFALPGSNLPYPEDPIRNAWTKHFTEEEGVCNYCAIAQQESLVRVLTEINNKKAELWSEFDRDTFSTYGSRYWAVKKLESMDYKVPVMEVSIEGWERFC